MLYDATTSREYDFWQATTALDGGGNSLGGGREGNRILEAGTIDHFEIGGPGTNVTGNWSARATGTPLLAGLIALSGVSLSDLLSGTRSYVRER